MSLELIPLGLQGWRHFFVHIRKEVLHWRFWFLFCLAHSIEYILLFFLNDGLDLVIGHVIVFVELEEILEAIERITLLGKILDLLDTAVLRRIIACTVETEDYLLSVKSFP